MQLRESFFVWVLLLYQQKGGLLEASLDVRLQLVHHAVVVVHEVTRGVDAKVSGMRVAMKIPSQE